MPAPRSPDPLIITVAGIGAELTKKHTPYVPVSPDEIIAEACEVASLGAQVFHLHVRDGKGRPTCDPKYIRPVIREIRKQTELIIQISTGGDINDTAAARLRTLDCGSHMGSLTLGSVNFGSGVFLNPLPLIEKLALKMKQKGIVPELEIFDVAMVETAVKLLEKGILKAPLHFNIILGGPGWLAATEENLDFILQKLPKNSSWSGSGVGRHQLPMIGWAIERGGHVRTGLEDNIYLSKGALAKGNGELVEQALRLAKKFRRRLATPAEARKICLASASS